MDKTHKLAMHTKDKSQENFEKLKALFPNAVTETVKDGKIVHAIDKDVLMQEINAEVVEGKDERYQFTWPEKKKAAILANVPTTNTLRPCEEESVNFNTTKNLYIEGDNLEVLKVLQETYFDKIALIYIDPPYNTGNDILYKNNYHEKADEFGEKYEIDENGNRFYINTDTNGRYHTNWLNMMYSRIHISKSLLQDNGFFLLAIDHNELFNIGKVCDEIFGFNNRVGIISVVHKPEGRNQAKFIGPSNEFMLIYAKNENLAKLQKVALDEEQIKSFSCSDDKGAYRLKNFIRLSDGKYATRENKPNFWYPIYVSNDLTKLSLTQQEDYIPIYPVTETGVERTWKTSKETFLERYNQGDIIAKLENEKIKIFEKLREDQVIKTHWVDKKYHGYHFGTKILDQLLEVKTFDFPKSVFLMKDIIKLFMPKNGLIFDFFSGSATTAHAVFLANQEDNGSRSFILNQIPASCDENSEAYKAGYKNICEIGKERIRRAGKKILQENNLPENDLDIGFRVLKLDTTNMKDVYYTPAQYQRSLLDNLENNIKEDRSPEDLLFQVLLDLGVELSSSIASESIGGKTVFNVENNYCTACFDTDLTDAVITEIAKKQPVYAVFRDMSFNTDSVGANVEQIFKTYSPNTKITVL